MGTPTPPSRKPETPSAGKRLSEEERASLASELRRLQDLGVIRKFLDYPDEMPGPPDLVLTPPPEAPDAAGGEPPRRAGPPRGHCAARLDDGSLCGAPASIQAAGGLLCEAHARRLAAAYDSFRRFRVTPEEEEGGLIQALAALSGYAQARLLTCLRGLGLPETGPDASGSAAEQCADILLRLSSSLISRRWRGGDPTLPL